MSPAVAASHLRNLAAAARDERAPEEGDSPLAFADVMTPERIEALELAALVLEGLPPPTAKLGGPA